MIDIVAIIIACCTGLGAGIGTACRICNERPETTPTEQRSVNTYSPQQGLDRRIHSLIKDSLKDRIESHDSDNETEIDIKINIHTHEGRLNHDKLD